MSDDLELFFPELYPSESGVVPLPPGEMRFTELRAEPVIDEGPLRLRVYVEVTAFQQRPYMEISLCDSENEEIASASIIEPMQRRNVITIHVRGGQRGGEFSLHGRLFYPDQPDSDTRSVQFVI